jgi:hypothetical protein
MFLLGPYRFSLSFKRFIISCFGLKKGNSGFILLGVGQGFCCDWLIINLKTWVMKQLTREEAKLIKTRPEGRTTYARGILMNMNVGDIILLEPKEWTQKHRKPRTYCLQLGRKTHRTWKCVTALDGSGWVIERVK